MNRTLIFLAIVIVISVIGIDRAKGRSHVGVPQIQEVFR